MKDWSAYECPEHTMRGMPERVAIRPGVATHGIREPGASRVYKQVPPIPEVTARSHTLSPIPCPYTLPLGSMRVTVHHAKISAKRADLVAILVRQNAGHLVQMV